MTQFVPTTSYGYRNCGNEQPGLIIEYTYRDSTHDQTWKRRMQREMDRLAVLCKEIVPSNTGWSATMSVEFYPTTMKHRLVCEMKFAEITWTRQKVFNLIAAIHASGKKKIDRIHATNVMTLLDALNGQE